MTARHTNHLLQIVHQRVNRLATRLEPQLWQVVAPLAVQVGALHQYGAWTAVAEAAQETLRPLKGGDHLGSGWNQQWCRVDIPAGRGERHLRWRCQGEATVWLNGEPYAGLDVAHHTCLLPTTASTLWISVGLWQTGLWVPGATPITKSGAQFNGCDIVTRNEMVRTCLMDVAVWRQWIDQAFADAGLKMPNAIGWCAGLDRVDPALRLVLGGLDRACDAYDVDGLSALVAALAGIRSHLRAASWAPTVSAIAHSHIDLVYLWPERVAIEKAVHTCSTQMRLLDANPSFRFTHSQPIQCRHIERRSPELLQRIKERIAEGRWEITGGFACEPDTNMPCGETLFRSLQVGQRITKELTGAPSTVCWLPDVFGYSACLPGLLHNAGIKGFVTTKLSWSGITKFPWSSFVWKGHDGVGIVAHLVPVSYNTNARDAVANVVEATRACRDIHIHDDVLVPMGYGDGGGGPDQDLLDVVDRLGDLVNMPKTTFDRADAFIERLSEKSAQLPVHQGELYLEYHRGVLTTQQRFKRAYRRLEQALQAWEAVRSVHGGGAVDELPWERLFLAQFHDALPGTSIALVYEEGTADLEQQAIAVRQQAEIEAGGSGALPYNPLPYPIHFVDGETVWKLPALSTGTVVQLPVVHTEAHCLDNGVVRFTFTNGQLTGCNGTLLRSGGFTVAPDNPANYDAWEIERPSVCLAQAVAVSELTIAGPGMLRGTLTLPAGGTATVTYRLLAGERYVRVGVAVDWRENHRLLRYEVDTGCVGLQARFGCPFGSVLRTQQASSPQVEAMWEVSGSRWAAALLDNNQGVAIVTDHHWGFSCRDGILGVSLLRGPTYPDANTDQGLHDFEFAVGAYAAEWQGEVPPTAAMSDVLFVQPLRVAKPVTSSIAIPYQGSCVPAWVCPVDAAHVDIRWHEVAGGCGTLALTAQPISALDGCGEKSNQHAYGPYQFLSLRSPRP